MKLPAPHEIRPMPDDVMNWEKEDNVAPAAEVERLRQALRDRDSDIVQEQIGDDARAELKRLRQALSVVRNVAEGALS